MILSRCYYKSSTFCLFKLLLLFPIIKQELKQVFKMYLNLFFVFFLSYLYCLNQINDHLTELESFLFFQPVLVTLNNNNKDFTKHVVFTVIFWKIGSHCFSVLHWPVTSLLTIVYFDQRLHAAHSKCWSR